MKNNYKILIIIDMNIYYTDQSWIVILSKNIVLVLFNKAQDRDWDSEFDRPLRSSNLFIYPSFKVY